MAIPSPNNKLCLSQFTDNRVLHCCKYRLQQYSVFLTKVPCLYLFLKPSTTMLLFTLLFIRLYFSCHQLTVICRYNLKSKWMCFKVNLLCCKCCHAVYSIYKTWKGINKITITSVFLQCTYLVFGFCFPAIYVQVVINVS